MLDGDGKLPPPQASSKDATQLGDAIKDCSMNAAKYYDPTTLLSSAPLYQRTALPLDLGKCSIFCGRSSCADGLLTPVLKFTLKT